MLQNMAKHKRNDICVHVLPQNGTYAVNLHMFLNKTQSACSFVTLRVFLLEIGICSRTLGNVCKFDMYNELADK